ncbi:MAG: sigma-70 family RNA polymerase sigma factor [Chloroflexi bacterium]|jgi:RNA polymerase sigma-70 factor, ECF subfamily|nr:sigma-70 family RNA polymerase sigma factor [Chloroflexota bacterium]
MAKMEIERKKLEEMLVALYEESYDKVARYIFIRIGNQQEAEDLASETFVRALKSLNSYQERGLPMEAWIFKIAHNIVVDYLRKVSKRQMVNLDEVTIADDSNPEEAAVSNDQIARVTKALGGLSPSQREVIALRFFSGLSSTECGKVMGRQPGAVREMQSAAIKSLRHILYKDTRS